MNIRKRLADLIAAEAPEDWDVFSFTITPENPLKPMVVVRQIQVAKTPGAPRLYRDVDFSVALVEPGLAPDKVEDALDADVDTLIDILESVKMPGLVWKTAERVTFDSRFHGYDIHLTITTEKEPTP